MVANLEEILTPDIVSERDFVNTELLVTLVVIVPKYVDRFFVGARSYTCCGAGMKRRPFSANTKPRLGTALLAMAKQGIGKPSSALLWCLDRQGLLSPCVHMIMLFVLTRLLVQETVGQGREPLVHSHSPPWPVPGMQYGTL